MADQGNLHSSYSELYPQTPQADISKFPNNKNNIIKHKA